NFADPFGLLCPGVRTSSGRETTAPCELMLAVFSEAASGNSSQALGIAYTVMNRANDSRHTYRDKVGGNVRNSGDLYRDVREHSMSVDIQGVHDSRDQKYSQGVSFIETGHGIDPGNQADWNQSVDAAEGAYTGSATDPTNGATFFAHGKTVAGSGA